MTGVSEILVLVLLIACILILPRLLKGVPANRAPVLPANMKRLRPLGRLGIVLSILYPIVSGLVIRPWEPDRFIPFLSYGLLPVFIVWGLVWIIAGRKNK